MPTRGSPIKHTGASGGGGGLKRARLKIIFSVKVKTGFIVFATDEQICLMGECSSLHMEGTLKMFPRPFAQVL
jgi:hypothetical protein